MVKMMEKLQHQSLEDLFLINSTGPMVQSTQYVSDLRPKKYSLIVTDEHDCQDTASVVIEEPEELLLRVEAHRPTIEGAQDGAIFSKVFGGTPAHIATWEIESGADMWSLLSETDLEINDLGQREI